MTCRFVFVVSIVAAFGAPALAMADEAQTTTQAPAATATQAPGGQPDAAVAVQPQATSSAADLDRIECRSSPPPIGSRLGPTRECHSVRDWNAREQQDQHTLRKMQSTPFTHF